MNMLFCMEGFLIRVTHWAPNSINHVDLWTYMTSYIRNAYEYSAARMRHKTDAANSVVLNWRVVSNGDLTSVIFLSPFAEERCVGVGHIHHSVIRKL